MGGTSTDVALIENGTPGAAHAAAKSTAATCSSRCSTSTPSRPAAERCAWIDTAGRAASRARRAPARIPDRSCYGQGGTQPDDHRRQPRARLSERGATRWPAGRSRSIRGRRKRAIEEQIAEPLGLSVIDAARGIVEIVNVKMQEAIKVVSSNRGYDLRDFHLLAFGGAGAAARRADGARARDEGRARAGVPGRALARWGCCSLTCATTTSPRNCSRIDKVEPAHVARRLRSSCGARRRRAARAGLPPRPAALRVRPRSALRRAGLRADGRASPTSRMPPRTASHAPARFDASTTRSSTGHSAPDELVEIVNYRVTAVAVVPKASIASPFLKTTLARREARRARYVLGRRATRDDGSTIAPSCRKGPRSRSGDLAAKRLDDAGPSGADGGRGRARARSRSVTNLPRADGSKNQPCHPEPAEGSPTEM